MAFSLRSSSVRFSFRALAISFATTESVVEARLLFVGLEEPVPEPDPEEVIFRDLRMLFSMVASKVKERGEGGVDFQ